ncbi:MAG: hypothetical protein HY778_10670 [Betaproteobacteria bacterium]|nr:hypothetical protein [Betaproteobacteria bacterium]
MARIPETEIERLKDEVSVQRLVEASGVELKKSQDPLPVRPQRQLHGELVSGSRS